MHIENIWDFKVPWKLPQCAYLLCGGSSTLPGSEAWRLTGPSQSWATTGQSPPPCKLYLLEVWGSIKFMLGERGTLSLDPQALFFILRFPVALVTNWWLVQDHYLGVPVTDTVNHWQKSCGNNAFHLQIFMVVLDQTTREANTVKVERFLWSSCCEWHIRKVFLHCAVLILSLPLSKNAVFLFVW